MTVTNETSVVNRVYAGPGVYTFPFLLYDVSHLVIKHISTEGAITVLTTGDFSATTLSPSEGGEVTVTTLVLPSSGTLQIKRYLEYSQETDWVNNGPFDMNILERAVDELVMRLQQLRDEVGDAVAAVTWRGTWTSGQLYELRELVVAPNTNWYACVVPHTASADFATDLAAGYWVLALDLTAILAMQTAAETAQALAEVAQGLSEDARDASVIAQGLSETAQGLSEAARDASVLAQGLSEDARDAAIVAQGLAEDARDATNTLVDTAFPISTSVTSNYIAPNMNKTFTTQAGKRYIPGQAILAVYNNVPTNWMHGYVVSYDISTGVLVMHSVLTSGSGTYTNWTLAQSSQLTTTLEDLANASEASSMDAAGYAAAALQAALNAQSVVNQDLSAIAASLLSSTGVSSVFIYDTTKDSDGGAWRERCEHLSWYNEPLNTATRGKTRKFPKVALIVSYGAAVRIFDATDPTLPMWRVFTGGTNNWMNVISTSSVAMKDGHLCVGTDAVLATISFLHDGCAFQSSGGSNGYWKGTISQSNDGLGYVLSTFTPIGKVALIVGSSINKVAITTIGTAPIDQTTGLPVPTIGVATTIGCSIINGPAGVGTVVNMSQLAYGFSDIRFDNDLLYVSYSAFSLVLSGPIPSVNVTSFSVWSTADYSDSKNVVYIPNIMTGTAAKYANGAIGNASGVSWLKENLSDYKLSLANYITKDYQTGWMPGDIKLATLSDTVAGVITSANSVADRSINNKPLSVVGTITKAPVAAGSELVGYSGFSVSNYLEQPINTDLDFGTGDFHFTGWSKSDVVATEMILDRRAIGSTSEGFSVYTNSSGYAFRFGSSGAATTIPRKLGVWEKIDVVRISGIVHLYVDGIWRWSLSMATTVDTIGVSRIGLISNDVLYPFTGSIALVRVSKTVPSADEMAWMYAQEKNLFYPDAKCTIQGDSSAVTALDYDETTDQLLVGTSGGTTVFSKGVVVDEIAGVPVALSADAKRRLIGTTANVTYSEPEIGLREQLIN